MAARSVDPINRNVRTLHSVSRWRAHARRHPLRYRLAVVAPSADDVIRHAGGWLFDRTTAGWEVTVLVSDCANVRPLGILGVTVLDLEQAMAAPVHDTWPNALAIASSTYLADERVRSGVLECFDQGLIEISLWGDEVPIELARRVELVQRPVSCAARAFKACALEAAGHTVDEVGASESFRAADLPRRQCDEDLASAR